MATLKTNEIEGWLSRPQPRTPIVLIYGADHGLVSERARQVAEHTGLALSDPFSVARFEASELDREPGRLIDEAQAIPMFAGQRLLWIKNAGAQKSLAEDVKRLCAAPPADTILLIEAGELKKSAALRSVIEADRSALAIPCYADDAGRVDFVIDGELAKAGLTIEPAARQALRQNLGGDRMASRSEMQKLVLYALGNAQITLADVEALTGNVSAISVDEVVDAALDGRIDDFDAGFARMVSSGGQTYAVLGAAIRALQTLQGLRGIMQGERKSAAAVISAARPPIFFTRRTLVQNALARWDGQTLADMLARLRDTVLATRRTPDLAMALTRQAMMRIAVEASRRPSK